MTDVATKSLVTEAMWNNDRVVSSSPVSRFFTPNALA